MDPRNAHVGKSEAERQQYHAFLRTPQPEDPTYDSDEPDLTNVPQSVSADRPSDGGGVRRPYNPQKERSIPTDHLIGILIGVFLFILTGLIGLFAVSLNREVGVLDERQSQVKESIDELRGRFDSVERSILEIELRDRLERESRSDIESP